MYNSLRSYLDLTRLHFFLVWSLLFCSGLFLSFPTYGGFSWMLVLKAGLIALVGFEAGFVLNDVVDADLDKRDVDQDLTKYWRPFGSRPIARGDISKEKAQILFLILFGVSSTLILTISKPNSYYVFGIMVGSYCLEYFYQVRKRGQRLPLAQLIGRIDFSLFPVAGYLVNGRPDALALRYFLFFYPFAQAHLGINDLIDINNDVARGLYTIPVLYGVRNTKYWILGFSLLNIISGVFFLNAIGGLFIYALIGGSLILVAVNLLIWKGETPLDWLIALPLFHFALFVYMIAMIVNYFI
jgi:4-hydroxybenzoate polyprenyltransferase